MTMARVVVRRDFLVRRYASLAKKVFAARSAFVAITPQFTFIFIDDDRAMATAIYIRTHTHTRK
jgi:hypothetical protein